MRPVPTREPRYGFVPALEAVTGAHARGVEPTPHTMGPHSARKASIAYDRARTPGGILSVRALIVG